MDTCAVCGGSEKEHNPESTRHAFTTKPGELKTWDQLAKEQDSMAQSAQRSAWSSKAQVMMPTNNPVERLTTLLLEKGILDADDVVFVFLGRR